MIPLPPLSSLLTSTRATLINTRGLALFKGFPVKEWGVQKSTTAYMGLWAHFGNLVSQNDKGHQLDHVRDSGEDATM